MCANPAAEIVAEAWDESPANSPGVDINSIVLMPDHSWKAVAHFKKAFRTFYLGSAPTLLPTTLSIHILEMRSIILPAWPIYKTAPEKILSKSS
jgi:hypothetical protein